MTNSDVQLPNGPLPPCPECGCEDIRTSYEEDRFTYGHGPEAVELNARVPVQTCARCAFQFIDDTAEEIRHEAVCRHLQVMTPKQITDLRNSLGLTRSELARLTRIGEASLARWENGAVIQNAANDGLLYLLNYPETVERLLNRHAETEAGVTEGGLAKAQPNPAARKSIFTFLELTDALIRDAATFTLVPSSI